MYISCVASNFLGIHDYYKYTFVKQSLHNMLKEISELFKVHTRPAFKDDKSVEFDKPNNISHNFTQKKQNIILFPKKYFINIGWFTSFQHRLQCVPVYKLLLCVLVKIWNNKSYLILPEKGRDLINTQQRIDVRAP